MIIKGLIIVFCVDFSVVVIPFRKLLQIYIGIFVEDGELVSSTGT